MRLQGRWMGVVSLLALLTGAAPLSAQDAKPDAFQAIHTELDQARTDKVDVLAPKSFARALSLLQDAEKDAAKGRKPEQVSEKLKASEQSLSTAQKFAASSRQELASVIRSRDDAVTAKAPQFASEAWKTADDRFHDAVDKIERQDADGARRKGAEAEVLMRDAELLAIKSNLLGEARTLIAQAEQKKVADYAPRSLAAAKRYLEQADQEIGRNRYDDSVPKRLTAQAVYEAKHAIYLAEQIGPLLEKDSIKQQGLEQMMLNLEEPIRRVAGELDIEPRFDQGYLRPMQDLYDKVKQQHHELSMQRENVRNRDDQIAALTTEIKQLQTKLGGESDERLALQQRLSAQDRIRENVSKIEAMFTADEGSAYRPSNDIVMSLPAISFRVCKSTIEPESFAVLAKVGDAIKLFPAATLTVEGHTDNQGSDSANLLLSQDRADAVRQYLISNLGVEAEKITSIGYGKSRPVATNDTDSGRARNRRIDIVMKIGGN